MKQKMQQNDVPTPNPEVSRVAARIPLFWAADPKDWFAQVENQFAIAGIINDQTKFSYIAGHLTYLEAPYAAKIRNMLTNPLATDKYEKLKTELIDHLLKITLTRQ